MINVKWAFCASLKNHKKQEENLTTLHISRIVLAYRLDTSLHSALPTPCFVRFHSFSPCPLQSHSRKPAFRYTQLDLFLVLWRELRRKQHPVVFSVVPQRATLVALSTQRARGSSLALSEQKKNTSVWMCFLLLVAGAGFEPHDLRVMSPTSYQAAPPRDIWCR